MHRAKTSLFELHLWGPAKCQTFKGHSEAISIFYEDRLNEPSNQMMFQPQSALSLAVREENSSQTESSDVGGRGAGGGRGKVSFPGNQFRMIIQNPCSFSFPVYYQKQTMCLRFINRDWCLGVFRALWESRGSFSFDRILTLILCLRGITLLRFRQTIGVLLLRWVF